MIKIYIDIPILEKRKNIYLLDILFGFYIFCQTCSGNSILGKFSIILLTVVVLITSLQRKKFFISTYFILEILFICYCFYQYRTGIAVLGNVAMGTITKLILLFLINITIVNYIIIVSDIERVLKVYMFGLLLGYIVILICAKDTLLLGRIGGDAVLEMFGIEFTGGVSVRIGYGAGLGAFISTFIYYGKNKYKFYAYFAFFTIVLALSGTRKSIFFVAASLLFIPMFKYPKKSLKTLFIIIGLGIVLYLAFMNIPALYQTLGYRLEEGITYFITGSTTDSSILTRSRLIKIAQQAFNKRRLTGWGVDNFRDLFYFGKYYTHNNFWEMLVNGGIIGFCLYYSKYIFLFLKLVIGIIKKTGDNLFYYKSFLLLLTIATAMEYWQVTYSQRTMVLANILILGSIIVIEKSKIKGESINA